MRASPPHTLAFRLHKLHQLINKPSELLNELLGGGRGLESLGQELQEAGSVLSNMVTDGRLLMARLVVFLLSPIFPRHSANHGYDQIRFPIHTPSLACPLD